ncbi:hypothetical protein BJN34_03990 [Cupriavidus necator]|uniref:Fimbrial protein n=1 Tax=Cupriavidus necator TaxID=106590 RepID=A0A1U9UJV8_CUPNE|nr:hypothetical protein [Cupriavidus necator]AQV93056.1 hypothetical protein BJN34_03990 [Cupriavidus necator]
MRLVPGRERIELIVPPDALGGPDSTAATGYSKGGWGGVFNYDVLGVQSGGAAGSSSLLQGMTDLGFNAGDWVVRSRQSFSSNSNGTSTLDHQYAYAQRSFAQQKQVALVGGAWQGPQPVRPISALTVQCDSQTSIGLRAVDNRSGVIDYGTLALAGGGTVAPAQTDRRFSLGQTSAGKPVGVWAVALSGASVDGVPSDIGVVAGGVLQAGDRDKVLRNDGKALTWVSGGQLATGRVFSVSGDVSVGVARLGELPGAAPVRLDGMATIEVIYL